jgi:nucleotide-binding universal stress UspA family protein
MKKYLEGVVAIICQSRVEARYEVLYGSPSATLIDYVKNHPTQLIAMATHGQSFISRLIFGSVTENIVNLVKKTPIFLVKPARSVKK